MNDVEKPVICVAGKGDGRRPCQISREEFAKNWDAINWRKPKTKEHKECQNKE